MDLAHGDHMHDLRQRMIAAVVAVDRISADVAEIPRSASAGAGCGKAPVSKALRARDPVWRAFDTPSNLLAVCDACYDAGRLQAAT